MQGLKNPLNRRSFLQYTGAGVAASALLLAGCDDDDDITDTNTTGSVNLGTGDTGILNYAYALEQLEAAFYSMVVTHASFQSTFSNATERSVLMDIRDHEVAHREFFKSVLGNSAIPALTPNFSAVNFADRTSVLMTARTFEDLGVAAYNGAGKLLTSATNLTLAGKIVSVEARHAAEIREMVKVNTFAARGATPAIGQETIITGGTANGGLDMALLPSQVLPLAQPFIRETINASNLPTI